MLWPANGNWPYELRGGRADALAFLWMNAVLGGLFVPMYVAAKRHEDRPAGR